MFGLRVSEQVSYDLGLVILEVPAASRTMGGDRGRQSYRGPPARRCLHRRSSPGKQKRRAITDPLFIEQWHLDKHRANGAARRVAISNVSAAWASVLGTGVNIAIVD